MQSPPGVSRRAPAVPPSRPLTTTCSPFTASQPLAVFAPDFIQMAKRLFGIADPESLWDAVSIECKIIQAVGGKRKNPHRSSSRSSARVHCILGLFSPGTGPGMVGDRFLMKFCVDWYHRCLKWMKTQIYPLPPQGGIKHEFEPFKPPGAWGNDSLTQKT